MKKCETPNSIRIVLLPEDTVKIIKEKYEKIPSQSMRVSNSAHGRCVGSGRIPALHDRIIKEIGAEHSCFHDLRHTFATLSLKNGVDVRTLSEMLRHYSAGFTLNTYVHSMQSVRIQAVDRTAANNRGLPSQGGNRHRCFLITSGESQAPAKDVFSSDSRTKEKPPSRCNPEKSSRMNTFVKPYMLSEAS